MQTNEPETRYQGWANPDTWAVWLYLGDHAELYRRARATTPHTPASIETLMRNHAPRGVPDLVVRRFHAPDRYAWTNWGEIADMLNRP